MIRSMTGFGSSLFEYPEMIIKTEIRSLNSKQLDLKIRMPLKYAEKESDVQNYIEKRLDRGKIDLNISVQFRDVKKVKKTINKELFKAYYDELIVLVKELQLSDKDLLRTIITLPDVISAGTESQELDAAEWDRIMVSIDKAVIEIDNYRADEGGKLGGEILSYISIIDNLNKEIHKEKNSRIDKIRGKFEQKLLELDNDKIDRERFEQELVYYFEKMDITEEIERLSTHLDYFRITMNEENSGRKLNFISQEIGREVNTIGSKANDAGMQKKVVEMKNELEKIKQQLANIL